MLSFYHIYRNVNPQTLDNSKIAVSRYVVRVYGLRGRPVFRKSFGSKGLRIDYHCHSTQSTPRNDATNFKR